MASTTPFNGINIPASIEPTGPSTPVPATKGSTTAAPTTIDVAPHIIKAPALIRGLKEPPTGARFMPGRVARADARNKDQIIFWGEPYYNKIVTEEGGLFAGVPFGPGEEQNPAAQVTIIDTYNLEGGGHIIRPGVGKGSATVNPQKIPVGKDKERLQIYQYSAANENGQVRMMPPVKGKFTWQIWCGWYRLWQLEQARILWMNDKFLHGAGPYQGAQDLSVTGQTQSNRLVKADMGPATEMRHRIALVDGIALWQAYIFVATYSRRGSQAILVRQLDQAYILTCAGGVPEVLIADADEYKHYYNDAGIPVPAKMAA